MKLFHKITALKILAIVLLIFIFVTSVTNYEILINAYKLTSNADGGFSEFISNVKTTYTSQIKNKTDYINLNGLFAKYTGRSVYNEVATLNNGMLTFESIADVDTKSAVESISQLAEWLRKSDRQFVYVQEPYKVDMNDELMPTGVNIKANEIADNMVNGLNSKGINVLDLREYLTKTPEQVKKHFYNTDHHWNNLGAFTAYNLLVEKIEELLPDKKINKSFTDSENWEKTVYKDWFLGVHGKRVGLYYGGLDDFVLYKPKFQTKISTYISNHLEYYKGDFAQANIREHYFDQTDYFNESPYCAYIGGDYPIVQHRNRNAGNNIKALIIKDSFQLPVQAFLSTAFAEVEVLDPRHYDSSFIAEYIDIFNPDVVIFMLNPSVMSQSTYYTYGIDKAEELRKATKKVAVYEKSNFEIKPNETQYNHITTTANLSGGTKYTFSVKAMELSGAEQPGVTVALFYPDGKKIYTSVVIDKENLTQDGHFEWTFVTPRINGNLNLIIYPGLFGKTQNSGAVIKEASLIRYEK